MQRFRARKVVEPPKGDFTMDSLVLMETDLCDKDWGCFVVLWAGDCSPGIY